MQIHLPRRHPAHKYRGDSDECPISDRAQRKPTTQKAKQQSAMGQDYQRVKDTRERINRSLQRPHLRYGQKREGEHHEIKPSQRAVVDLAVAHQREQPPETVAAASLQDPQHSNPAFSAGRAPCPVLSPVLSTPSIRYLRKC